MDYNQFQTYEENNYLSRRRFGFAILFYFLAFFVASIVVTTFVQLLYLGIYNNFKLIEKTDPRYEDFELFTGSIANFLIYLVASIFLVIYLKSSLKEDWQRTKKQILITILTGVGGWVIILLSVGIASEIEGLIRGWLHLPDITPENQESIIKLFSSKYLGLMLLVTLVGAPIVEELIFRKSIFGYFRSKFKLPPAFLIIISGVLFGLIHIITPVLDGVLMGDSLRDIFNQFISLISYSFMGMALGIVYYIGKENIYVTFVTHFTQNFISSIGQIIILKFPDLIPK